AFAWLDLPFTSLGLTRISGLQFQLLRKFPSLTKLKLSSFEIAAEILPHLAKVTDLTLSSYDQLPPCPLPAVKRLAINKLTAFSQQLLLVPQLESLTMNRTPPSECVDFLLAHTGLTELRVIDLCEPTTFRRQNIASSTERLDLFRQALEGHDC